MDNSPAMRLTARGKKILARGLTGEEILFTKVSIGDGLFDYETESVYDLTEIRNWRMDLPITDKVVKGDGTVYIQAYLSNAEVYEGFACREHALIARDQVTGEEVIYAYRNCGDEYDFIPSNSGTAHKNFYVEYIAEIQDAQNITAVLDLSVAYLTRDTFEEHVNDEHPHPNTPNHFDDVLTTEKIWVTDADNHLHQMSVNNFKNLLKDSPADSTTALTAQDLGLDANILVIEDFQGRSVTDNYKIKVTSSAENGTLLGLESVDDLRLGSTYTISDGYNAEPVVIQSVRYNISGYHAKIEKPLSNSYNWSRSYLYRTTQAGADKKLITWQGAEFGGVEANIPRILELPAAADIYGDGFFSNGFFTLA